MKNNPIYEPDSTTSDTSLFITSAMLPSTEKIANPERKEVIEQDDAIITAYLPEKNIELGLDFRVWSRL